MIEFINMKSYAVDYNRNIFILINNQLYMVEQSSILLENSVIALLRKARDHPKQTYNELLEKMANVFIKTKEKNCYDDTCKIQQEKMRELWDNKEDEDWENA